MCGITGIFNYSGNSSLVSGEHIQAMTDAIRHRGPDDEGIFISPDHTVALGFRRLSIIDLSPAGHQPMSTPDGRYTIIFNGEIYNHRELRRDLELRGYSYRSQSDTETILYGYMEYGEAFIGKLYGMFGMAIWDTHKRKLLLVRDRIGIKPVYYTFQNGALFFGSEIKSLLKHPAVPRVLNEQGMYDYLSLLTTPPNETMFEGVFKLEAGHLMTVDDHGNIRKECYWDLTHRTEEYNQHDLSVESFCIENIRRLLRDSIKLRMMADVPFGVLLSGGIDSSLNVALMSELMSRPVDTFTVGFKDLQKYNELQYATQIAQQFGTNHHEILIDEQDAIDFIPNMIWHQDEPNADPVCIPLYYVSKLARAAGTIVVQVGEGSDEEFSGYLHYLRELRYYDYYYSMLPNVFQDIGYSILKTAVPESLLTEFARRASVKDTAFYGGALGFSEESKLKLLNPAYHSRWSSTGRIAQRFFDQLDGQTGVSGKSDQLRRMMYFEIKSRLAELLLMRVDKMSMAVSIEARVPFLDHRLVEFALQIPRSLKIKNGIPKYILKKAAEGIIPDNIIYRRKQGFAAPVSEWLRSGKLSSIAREAILSSRLMNQGMFDTNYVRHLFDDHVSGRQKNSNQLWTLLVLSMWHERNIP